MPSFVERVIQIADHADAGDIEAFLGLFAEDAVVDVGIPGVRDKASLTRAMRDRPAGAGGVKNRHVMTNLLFREQTGDSARGALYFTLMSSSAGKVAPVATGQYTFGVVRAGGRWQIQEWRAVVDAPPPRSAGEGAG